MSEELQNIIDMCLDVEQGNWPADAAIPEIKKVATGLLSAPKREGREREANLIGALISALTPFAKMHRAGSAPDEVACQRGTASDLTILTSRDFEWAAAILSAVRAELPIPPKAEGATAGRVTPWMRLTRAEEALIRACLWRNSIPPNADRDCEESQAFAAVREACEAVAAERAAASQTERGEGRFVDAVIDLLAAIQCAPGYEGNPPKLRDAVQAVYASMPPAAPQVPADVTGEPDSVGPETQAGGELSETSALRAKIELYETIVSGLPNDIKKRFTKAFKGRTPHNVACLIHKVEQASMLVFDAFEEGFKRGAETSVLAACEYQDMIEDWGRSPIKARLGSILGPQVEGTADAGGATQSPKSPSQVSDTGVQNPQSPKSLECGDPVALARFDEPLTPTPATGAQQEKVSAEAIDWLRLQLATAATVTGAMHDAIPQYWIDQERFATEILAALSQSPTP